MTEANEHKFIGYKLLRVGMEEFSGMQPASSSYCPVSRICFSGSGHRRDILHPSVVDLLVNDKLTQQIIRERLKEVNK